MTSDALFELVAIVTSVGGSVWLQGRRVLERLDRVERLVLALAAHVGWQPPEVTPPPSEKVLKSLPAGLHPFAKPPE